MKTAHNRNRRYFLCQSLGLIVAAMTLPLVAPVYARSRTVSDPAELEIAALGAWLLVADPESATKLEAEARDVVELSLTDTVSWPAAQRARKLLTEPARVAAELAKSDIVFVDDWLLTRSEASTAVLFAVARAQSQSISQDGIGV